jgi:hypothetical protein
VEQCGSGLQRMGCLKENYIQATECGTTKKNPKQNMPKFKENPKLEDEMIFPLQKMKQVGQHYQHV